MRTGSRWTRMAGSSASCRVGVSRSSESGNHDPRCRTTGDRKANAGSRKSPEPGSVGGGSILARRRGGHVIPRDSGGCGRGQHACRSGGRVRGPIGVSTRVSSFRRNISLPRWIVVRPVVEEADRLCPVRVPKGAFRTAGDEGWPSPPRRFSIRIQDACARRRCIRTT